MVHYLSGKPPVAIMNSSQMIAALVGVLILLHSKNLEIDRLQSAFINFHFTSKLWARLVLGWLFRITAWNWHANYRIINKITFKTDSISALVKLLSSLVKSVLFYAITRYYTTYCLIKKFLRRHALCWWFTSLNGWSPKDVYTIVKNS